ncbi:MAG: hypothetical protein K5908_07800 [Erysipelotrichaceae bacterium]|nr:hypothetical protein [Erysipelotrichaceae bacterium]
MLKKIAIIAMLLIGPITINNGYYQTTSVRIDGIEGTCYGTLLSKQSVSGIWTYQLEIDYNAPEKVKAFFRDYQDDDGYFYLNFFQDVSEGLIYWPIYPPEEFKVLLYFPDSDTFMVSEDSYQRYSLGSEFRTDISDGTIALEQDYDYPKLIVMTLVRIVIGIAVSILVAFMYGKPIKKDYLIIILSNTIFHILLNIAISLFSFRYGFSIVNYFLFVWLIYVPFIFLQGYLYKEKTYSLNTPYFCSLYTNVAAYAAGLFLVDCIPSLFTIY